MYSQFSLGSFSYLQTIVKPYPSSRVEIDHLQSGDIFVVQTLPQDQVVQSVFVMTESNYKHTGPSDPFKVEDI